jgi:hypothetical protein
MACTLNANRVRIVIYKYHSDRIGIVMKMGENRSDVPTSCGAVHSSIRGINNMSNNLKNLKTIERESTRKLLHQVGNCPPAIDPFSRQGAQEWNQWTETCQNLESELRSLGESL